MNEADRQVIRLALGEGYHMAVNDEHVKLYLQALAILDADKPTVPMALLRELNGDWVHPSLDYAVRETLIEIASRFGYGVTE